MKFLAIADILNDCGQRDGSAKELGIVEDLDDAAAQADRAGLVVEPNMPLDWYTDNAPYHDEDYNDADAVAYLMCTVRED
ncbi:hypothetical protein DWF04_015325 [Cereibacter sphaeroides f. sp. denitrificans]|nr:hypothetical protein DWF04_16590 [Cereibacter sphaeroides f. sp. denitrificans]